MINLIWAKENNRIYCIYSSNNKYFKKNGKLSDYVNHDEIQKLFEGKNFNSDNFINGDKNYNLIKLNKKLLIEIISTREDCKINANFLSLLNSKIRTHLHNMLGIVGELQKTNTQDKKLIKILSESTSNVLTVISDVTDIINIYENNFNLILNHHHLEEIIKESYKNFNNMLKNKNISGNLKVAKNLPEIIHVDKVRLKQVLINLLKNAIENMDNGVIEISVMEINDSALDDNFHNILFKIKDNGFGMDKEKEDYINMLLGVKKNIDAFKSYKKAGFGLILCKEFVNLMGGKIWFVTEYDIGTVFYFNIICSGINYKLNY